jgi:WD40 repeat protein
VLLYELLTGESPLSKEHFREAAYEEIRRVIREEEPPRPSTRISTLGEAAATASGHRQETPGHLRRLLEGELDWIVMKALEKDRSRRYETANAYAKDIQRYLKDEPVQACPPSAVYRFKVFARRNKVALATTALVSLALLFGCVISTWQAIRATENERQAHNLFVSEQRARTETQAAIQQARKRLYEAYLANAKASRWSGRMGRRFDGLTALAQAAELGPQLPLDADQILDLRDEAIACLALTDLRVERQWRGDPAGTTAVVIDRELKHYARGDRKGKISVRRVSDDREVIGLPATGLPAWNLAFSPDGRMLASNYHFYEKFLPMHVWDVQNGKVFLKVPDAVGSCGPAFSSDNSRMAVGLRDGSTRLWDLSKREEIARLDTGPVWRLTLHPGGRKLATCTTGSGNVQLWELETGDATREFPHSSRVHSIAWHPHRDMLATACADYNAYVWDIATGKQQAVLRGHAAEVTGVCFSADGDILISSSFDGTMRLWDPMSGRQRLSAPGTHHKLTCDDRQLAFENGSDLGLCGVAAGRECRTLYEPYVRQSKGPKHLDIGPDGRLMVSGSNDGVRVWDLRQGREIAHLPIGLTWTSILHPNARMLITSGDAGLLRWPWVSAIRNSRYHVRIGPPEAILATQPVGRASLAADGHSLAVVDADHVHVVDLLDPDKKLVLQGQPGLASVSVSPDGQWIAGGSHQGMGVRIWDRRTGKPVKDLLREQTWAGAMFSPDGQWLVTNTQEEYRLWTTGTWTSDRAFPTDHRAKPAHFFGMAFTPRGDLLAVAPSMQIIHLVNPGTGQHLATLEAPDPHPVSWLCFGPHEVWLAAANSTHRIQLWDLGLIRAQLAVMNLDWNMPPRPAETEMPNYEPAVVEVDLGDFTSAEQTKGAITR